MRVLIIEDHRDLAENMVDYLQARGHVADAAGDRVAGNLARNALQHARASNVDVRLVRLVRLDFDCLTVSDDGIGMVIGNPEGAERRDQDCWNTGLGLSLVQRLCDQFGWTLELSACAGEGARATWRFARIADQRESPSSRALSG